MIESDLLFELMFYLYWSITNKLKARISQLFDKHNTSRILVLVLLVFSFCPSLLNGQITWNKRFGVPGNGHPEVARSIEVLEDGYVVFYFDENPNGSNRMNVMKIDLEGDSFFGPGLIKLEEIAKGVYTYEVSISKIQMKSGKIIVK